MKNPALTRFCILIIITIQISSCKHEPHLTTSSPTNLTPQTATSGGVITDDGNATIFEYGLCWNTSPVPKVANFKKSIQGAAPSFSIDITGLTPGTKYYIRAYAINSQGIGYGNEVTIPYPPVWTLGQLFSPFLWANNLIAVDDQNFWMTAIPIPDITPVPNLPVHIYKSSDGGLTWTDNSIPDSQGKFAGQLAVLNASTAWINVSGIGLFKTINAGASWTLVNESTDFKTHSVFLHFFDNNEGVARFFRDNAGMQNDSIMLLKTFNGGISWSKIQYESQINRIAGEAGWYVRKGLFEAIGDTVACPTNCGRIFISYNRGNDWKAINLPSKSYEIFNSLAFITSRKFALTSLGQTSLTGTEPIFSNYSYTKVFATEDGGTTWLNPSDLNIFPGIINSIPGQKNLYLASGYHVQNIKGGTYISNDAGRNFVSADSLFCNLSVSAFSSINSGIGATFNFNMNPSVPPQNNIVIWSPERLYRNGTIPR